MPIYERIFKSVLFPGYETLVKRRGTVAHLAEYERSQWLDRAALEAVQLRKLNELLSHCWAHVPFLQRYWNEHGVSPSALQHPSELTRYPVLTKALISRNYDDMIATNWRGRTLSKTTGGSTGEPFRFEYTMDVYARRTAVMWRGYGWGGVSPGSRTAYLWGTAGTREKGWGRVRDLAYHQAFNRRFFDAFALTTDSETDNSIKALIAYRPAAVIGYVGQLVHVSQRMLMKGLKVKGIRSVLAAAETLYDHERDVIERAFGCSVFNTYGSREVMLIASECDRHRGLHVNSDHLIAETIGENGLPAPAGVSGDVAITDLHNYGMPLVRYLNGDRATYSVHDCSCGRSLPLLATVDGRVFDSVLTTDGRTIPGGFFSYLMIGCTDVIQWQVAQTAVDRLEVRLILLAPWSEEKCIGLSSKIQEKVGPEMKVAIIQVERILTTPSGKRRPVVPLSAMRAES